MSKDSSARYYHKEKKVSKMKKRFKKKSCEKYASLSEEEKHKKREYDYERYKDPSENEKQRLVEYRKGYHGILCKIL